MDYVIKINGWHEAIMPEGKCYTLEELQAIVGGYIEIVQLGDGVVMVVDEEGRLKGYEQNLCASFLAKRNIVGTVLVCDSKHID